MNQQQKAAMLDEIIKATDTTAMPSYCITVADYIARVQETTGKTTPARTARDRLNALVDQGILAKRKYGNVTGYWKVGEDNSATDREWKSGK